MPEEQTNNKTIGAGCIRSDAAYTLEAIRKELGLGQAAMRSARRNGLKVRRLGRRAFVLGADMISYLERVAE